MENLVQMIDFHAHILPCMDDGSNCIEESVAMLQESRNQGVDTIVATPHFYAERDTITHFLAKRDDRINCVKDATQGREDIPKLILGAEVLFFHGMSRAEQIPLLCIEDTNILLLEMPFMQWDESILREIDCLLDKRRLQVVIAHLDRYYRFQKNPFYLEELLKRPVGIQLNAEAFDKLFKRTVLALVKEGKVDALGSDCHNMRSRIPNLEVAAAVITKKLGTQYVEQITQKTNHLLQGGKTACIRK